MSVVRFPFFSSSESGPAMKRALFVVPVVAMFGLVGCAAPSVEKDAEPVAQIAPVLESSTFAPPVEPSKVEPNVSTGDQVDIVMQQVAADEGIHMPDGMATEYADIICEGLDDGLSPQMLVRIAVNGIPTWDADQHAFLIGVSIGAKCPEYAHVVGGVA